MKYEMIRLKEGQRANKMAAGVSLFVTGVLLTGGCKKDTNKAPDFETQTPDLKTTSEMTKADSLFSKKIVWFDSIMDNYKTIPNYSINEVEKLTLYVIELKKENEEIREEIIKLKN